MRRTIVADLAKFFGNVRFVDRECWLWLWNLSSQNNDFCSVWTGRKHMNVHAVAYELANGVEVPEGLVVTHTCRRPRCINPQHLRVMSFRAMVKETSTKNPCGINARKTECIRGHALSGENLYLNQYGGRNCRECRRMHSRHYKARVKMMRLSFVRTYPGPDRRIVETRAPGWSASGAPK